MPLLAAMSDYCLFRVGRSGGYALGAALALVSCGRSEMAIDLPEETGTLKVTWRIGATQLSSACDEVGAREAELALYDDGGELAVEAYADCAAFAVSIELPEGIYDARVTLFDDDGRPVSPTLVLEDLRVEPGTVLVSDVDFP